MHYILAFFARTKKILSLSLAKMGNCFFTRFPEHDFENEIFFLLRRVEERDGEGEEKRFFFLNGKRLKVTNGANCWEEEKLKWVESEAFKKIILEPVQYREKEI
jgi:hypothetical protein